MRKNLKPLTTDGSIMGPADKVCSCLLHWNHDDCTNQCSHEAADGSAVECSAERSRAPDRQPVAPAEGRAWETPATRTV